MKKIIALLVVSFGFTQLHAQDEEVHRNYVAKFAPTQLAAGEMSLNYEQRLAKFISVELDFGPTFSEFGINRSNHFLWGDLVWVDNQDVVSDMGFHISLAPRFYPLNGEYEMRGLYLSPVFKYRVYNSTYKYVGLEDQDGTLKQSIFRFNMGFQFWPGANKFSIDLFTGLGFSSSTDKWFTAENLYDANTGLYNLSWKENSEKRMFINGVVGVKFGFGQ